MGKMKVRVKKTDERAVIPEYASEGDAGMDLTAVEKIRDNHTQLWFRTGLAFEIPEGYVGYIFPRSSITKKPLELGNSVGVIDSGYRGEIQVRFNKNRPNYAEYGVGDRVAQIIIMPYPQIEFVEVDELDDSVRGEGGFGSTGE